MKPIRTLLLPILILLIQPAFAADDNLIPAATMNYIGFGAIVFMLVLIIIALLVVLRAFKILSRIILSSEGYTEQQTATDIKPARTEKKPKTEIWNKILSLKPLSEEKDLMMDHKYDDIEELDNPIPAWFMYLFYATIIFGVGYLLNYHVFKTGQLQDAEYRTEIAQADMAKKAFLGKTASLVDENTIKVDTDPAVIAAGKTIFKQSCAPCHGDNGQGVVGPNLTDDFWLHGGKISDVFKTIKYGVAAKGMPTWEKQLSPKQIADVSNYIESIHGSNPANPKEPQGTKDNGDQLASK